MESSLTGHRARTAPLLICLNDTPRNVETKGALASKMLHAFLICTGTSRAIRQYKLQSPASSRLQGRLPARLLQRQTKVFCRLNRLVILLLRYENRSVNAATRVPIVGQS